MSVITAGVPDVGSQPQIVEQLRAILRRDLKLSPNEPLPEDMRLVGSDLDLDSLDLLLLVTSIERQFGVRISSPQLGKEAFETVGSLARFVQTHGKGTAGRATAAGSSVTDILSRLPHGPEFRFISRIIEVRPGESARGIWTVDGSESFFTGHFPGNPIVPGVLIGEALAQVSGLALPEDGSTGGMLAQIELRFEQPVRPPANIELVARVATALGKLCKCDVVANVGNVVAARGTLTLARE